jgi:alpha-1,2-mannosyltransferase
MVIPVGSEKMPTRARRSRPFWAVQYREARGHAMILAGVLWIAAAVLILSTPGYRDALGKLKGADFVHFYTLGRIALTGRAPALYDMAAQHQLQVRLVPASARDAFLPVYPPQTALLFAPFALFSYVVAALMWAGTTAIAYGLLVRSAWSPARKVFPDSAFVGIAAAGFPPFWYLILHGQTTTMPLLAFGLGWKGLERNRKFLAGLSLGLLAIKPQFGLVLAVVVLVCGEWSLLAGLAVSIALQIGVVAAFISPAVLVEYGETLRHFASLAPLLEPRPYQLHSIRAITNLLPGSWLGLSVWALLSAVVIVRTVRVWRSRAPVAVRTGVLVVGSVLVNPHLTVYDATVLALAFLWLGAWVQSSPRTGLTAVFWPMIYGLFVTFLFPTALVFRVQLSVLLLGWFFMVVTRTVLEDTSGLSNSPMVSPA